MDDKMRVVSTEVVEEDCDSETDRSLQVALAVSCANEESSDVLMVSDLRPSRIVLPECVAADVALRRDLIFLLLLSAYLLHWSSCSELFENCRCLLDQDVQELGQRIFSDLHHRQLIVSTECRAENCRRGTHFVLLGVSCLLKLAFERLENGFEVGIDYKRRHSAELVIVEFLLSLFVTGRLKQM